MLRIRQAQMDAFQPWAEAQFEKEVMAYLRHEQADLVDDLPEEALRRRVRRGIAEARRWGFREKTAINGFILLLFQVGPDCFSHPAFRRALESGRGLPDENDRIRRVFNGVTDEEWEQAQAGTDETAWARLGSGSP